MIKLTFDRNSLELISSENIGQKVKEKELDIQKLADELFSGFVDFIEERKKKMNILEFTTKKEVEEYYYKNMSKKDEKSRAECLKKHSAKELDHIIQILYKCKYNYNKEWKLLEIQNYFDNIQRALNI